MKKKLFSLLVVVCMIIGMLPMIALADASTPYVGMDYKTGAESGDNSILVPDEGAWFNVTEPDSNGYTYLEKINTSTEPAEWDVAFIYEAVPTLYLNGVEIINAAPVYLYGWDGAAMAPASMKIVVMDDTLLYGVGGGSPAVSIMGGGDATLTCVDDALLQMGCEGAPELEHNTNYNPNLDGYTTINGVLYTNSHLTLENANIEIGFDANFPIVAGENKLSGICVDGGDLVISGGNIKIGFGLDAEVQEIVSPISVIRDRRTDNFVGGHVTIENGANVVLLQDNNDRPLRHESTLTISDSTVEIGSTGGRAAFASGTPVFDFEGEFTVVASGSFPTLNSDDCTITAPRDAAPVDPTATDADGNLLIRSYKYVKIYAGAYEGGEEGGEEGEPAIYGNAALKYRFDDGDSSYDYSILMQGEGAVYFVTTEADDDGINYLTTAGASEDNYNLKFEYLEGEAATLYFKDLFLKNNDPFQIYNADDEECPFVIVVESESWIESTDCDFGAFEIDTNAEVAITSIENAKLTLVGAHFPGYYPDNTQIESPGILNATDDLYLIEANVVVGYNLVWPGSTGVGLVGGDLYVYNSNLLVGYNLYDDEYADLNVPSWNDVTYSFYMMADSQGNGGNIFILEGSNVFAMGDQAYNVVHTDGDTYISDSTFEAGTEWGNTCVFEKAPILEYTDDAYEVSVTKTAPALNKEEMKLRPSKNGFVDYNEEDIQKYMYFKVAPKTADEGGDDTGDQGGTGNEGNQGNTGNEGNQGNTGNEGNQGNTGNEGNQGNTGNEGNTGNQGTTNNPQTGDNMNMVLWFALLGIAAIGMVSVLIVNKKKISK